MNYLYMNLIDNNLNLPNGDPDWDKLLTFVMILCFIITKVLIIILYFITLN